tara:strand:- start:585 stop:782 length:198 start_codon:yes stop_codon:yes gene_type:complete
MKNTQEQIDEITDQKMIYNSHQVQHILNRLIAGKVVDGSQIYTDKLIEYKLSLIKMEDKIETFKN